MSFIKIKDPRKREELIKDFIETRKRIKDNFIARKVGEAGYQTELTKLFKPVTETQKATAKEITEAQKATAEKFTSELLPIKESIGELATKEDIEILPVKLFNQIYPSLEFKSSEIMELGALAVSSLIEAFTKKGVDKTFGLYAENKKFKIGDKQATIKDNNIIIEGKIYIGTPGLWELVTSTTPQNFTEEDYINYRDLLIQTNTIYQGNNSNKNNPKSSKSEKWEKLIKPIWEYIKEGKGKGKGKGEGEGKGGKGGKGKGKGKHQEDPQPETSGTDPQPGTSGTDPQPGTSGTDPQPGTSGTDPQPKTPGGGLKFLSSDPNALINRFDLLFSSKKAGHTGVKNEIVSILDELKRQGVININEYKKLNSLIKK